MKNLSHLFLAFCFLFVSQNAVATHITGGEITYRTVGMRVYEVTFKLYRDCVGVQVCSNCQSGNNPGTCTRPIVARGIAPPAGIAHNLPTQTCSGTNYGTFTIPIASNIAVFDAVQLCNNNNSICRNCNTRTPGTFTPGMEVYTFIGNVNLSSIPASCCWVSLGIMPECCRNNANTTLQNPSSLEFFTDVQINTCLGSTSNSGPRFQNLPQIIFPSGVDLTYNPAAWDPEGDSLSYRFGSSLISSGTSAPYISPYSPTAPFPYIGVPGQSPPLLPPSGISLDPVLGTLRATPTGSAGVSNLVIEVLEWRRINNVPTLLSINRMDNQIYLQANSGGSPQIKVYRDGMLNNNLTFGGCGQSCFDIVANSSGITGNDTTDLEVLSNIGNVTVTRPYNVNTRSTNGPRFDTMRVCIQPSSSGPNSIKNTLTIIAKNRNCPVNNKTVRTIMVNHLANPYWVLLDMTNGEDFGAAPVGFPVTYAMSGDLSSIIKDSTRWLMAQPGSSVYNPIGLKGDTAATVTPLSEGWIKFQITVYSPACGNFTRIDSLYVIDLNVVLNKTINAKCAGDSNGAIIFSRYGAYSPISATVAPWSLLGPPNLRPWLPVDTISGLPAGLYRLKVKDASDRQKSIFVEIKASSSTPPTAGSANVNNLICNNDSSGSVTLSISGGSPSPLKWYSKDSINWQNSPVFNNLKAGTIKFHFRDSIGCGSFQNVTISQPSPIVTGSQVSEKIKCKDDSNGVISLFPSGGSMPYQTKINQGVFSSVFDYYGLKANTYTLQVKDNKGCIQTSTITLSEPNTKFTGTATVTQPTCSTPTGSLTLTAQGGNAPYLYGLSGFNPTTNNVFTNLTAGNKVYYARDSNLCVLTFNVNINTPSTINLSHTKTEIRCFGDTNGSIRLIASGGKRPYQYNINGGAYQSDSVFRNLGSGNYTLNLKDSTGCIKSLETNLITRTPISISLTATNESCLGAKNGSAKAVVSGGTTPYITTWLTNPVVNGLQVSGLGSGVAKFSVIDNAQCLRVDSVTIIAEPPFNGEVICGASYLPASQHTQISWNKTNGKKITAYKVFYQQGLSGSPVELATTTFSQPALLVDSVSPKNQLILYSISAIDSCGNPSTKSPLISAPLLEAAVSGGQTTLNWNYTYPAAGLSGLQLYKSINNGPFIPLFFAAPNVSSFNDTASSTSSRIYYLEAVYAPSCANNFRIYSNRVLLYPNSLTETRSTNSGFTLFPNPAENWVKVQSKSSQTFKALRIYNLQGQLVIEQTFAKPVLDAEISLVNLPKGVYQVFIDATGNGTQTMPLVVN